MTYQLNKLNVLCVDENKYMQQLYWTILSSLGFRKIRFARDGGEALEMMLIGAFDLIITDLNTTPIDGIEFLKFVRGSSDSTNPDIPIIVVSGSTEIRNVKTARDAGATEFMAKPISATTLYSRIASVIERPRDFVKDRSFKGPDRRRRVDPIFDGKDKRTVS